MDDVTMPFKSQAQRRKFAELLVQGKISPETYEEWNRETGGKKLPERATKPAGRTTRKSPKRKSTTARATAKRTRAARPARKAKRR
jgi:hypothetical protein